ncbi:adipokinetic hormone/corazonin-related peptide receptor variant I-like [Haliotis rubra]|uniref:adipokinetic hormone/corazonin-related peptide receptor variant I-like n=1 Tax=Haliotis rubra TaxID=36100 RepID=UPI001EE5611B|nr:adipokinetic hormone/corazonin-related peptide receptor variant I-like [Haliotis rubra]
MEFSQSTKKNIICDSVILYTGIFTNLGVLIHLHKTWISRNRVQVYVLVLCVADCLGLILRQCVEVGLHTTETWNTGEIGCKIIMSISMAGTFLAHLVLVTFNIDNLVVVTYKQSPSPVRLCQLACAVLMTALFIGVKMHLYHIEIHPIYATLRQCTPFGRISVDQELIYGVVDVVAVVLFPGLLIAVCGALAFIHRRNVYSTEKGVRQQYDDNDDAKRDLWDMKYDILYTTTLDCLFTVCWLPYSIMKMFLLTHTGLFHERNHYLKIWDALTYLSMVNHCFNPLVYGLFFIVYGRKKTPVHI